MGINLRYGPMDWNYKTNSYEFGGADITNIGNFNVNPYGGADYYVDGNIRDADAETTSDTSSWDKPYKVLSTAIAASNKSIALSANRWWARRNRIFVCGDQEITESLTNLPEKCDIIGMGFDVESMPRITGQHTQAAGGGGYGYGTRFFNCGFMGSSTGATFKFVTNNMAIEFYGCKFWPNAAGQTHCIHLDDDNRGFKMIGCQIYEHAGYIGTGIFAEAIEMKGTGQHDMIIKDNYIRASVGIAIDAGTQGYNGIIDNNNFHVTTLAIDDESDLWMIVNNKAYSAVTTTTAATYVEVYDVNVKMAFNNYLSAGDCTNARFPLIDETGT